MIARSLLCAFAAALLSTNASLSAAAVEHYPPTGKYKKVNMAGFDVMVHPDMEKDHLAHELLGQLAMKLPEIATKFHPKVVAQMRRVKFWIGHDTSENGGAGYHPSAEWLRANGRNPDMEHGIQIDNRANVLREIRGGQPMMLAHELAHSYESRHFSERERAQLTQAYQNAVRSKLYRAVRHLDGKDREHYAISNQHEYFAELTEAYVGKNDAYPFTREELHQYDPVGYALMEKIWKNGDELKK